MIKNKQGARSKEHGVRIHRIPCQITTKCGDFRYTPQPPQSPHIVVIYMRIAPHTPQCTSIAIPHNLSSCTSLHLIHLSASQTPQNGVISYIHPNHPKHPTLGWFIWGLHLIHLSAPQLPSLKNLNPQSWKFSFFSFRFIRGQGVNFLHYFGFFSLPKQSLGYKVSKNI